VHTERENLAPIAGGGHIVPGPVRGACPEPTEIVCVELNKVFDFCFQEHRVERTFPLNRGVEADPALTEIECEIDEDNITCREVGERREVPHQKNKFLVCVAVDVPVTFRIIQTDTDTTVATFQRVVSVRTNADSARRPRLRWGWRHRRPRLLWGPHTCPVLARPCCGAS
jgi:hypothetical protein